MEVAAGRNSAQKISISEIDNTCEKRESSDNQEAAVRCRTGGQRGDGTGLIILHVELEFFFFLHLYTELPPAIAHHVSGNESNLSILYFVDFILETQREDVAARQESQKS